MFKMKFGGTYTDIAYEQIFSFKDVEEFFHIAVIDYVKGSKVNYSESDTWPLQLFRIVENEIECVASIAVATAGYRGVGPLFTYNVLSRLGFDVGEEIFQSNGEKVHLEYYKKQ